MSCVTSEGCVFWRSGGYHGKNRVKEGGWGLRKLAFALVDDAILAIHQNFVCPRMSK